ncbi:MAG: hypothetical protein F6K55_01390, partial [Moorea sp. SIO4A3]|nr:hypothetical protein [Moorena sp. SIO4A3]
MSTDFLPNHDNNPKKQRIKCIKGSPEAVIKTIYGLSALGYGSVCLFRRHWQDASSTHRRQHAYSAATGKMPVLHTEGN